MSAQEQLRQYSAQRQSSLMVDVPSDRQAALLALVRNHDQLSLAPMNLDQPDLVTGRRLFSPGWNKALQIYLESSDTASPGANSRVSSLDGWALEFMQECDHLAEADIVLGHCETGFMRISYDGEVTFNAWIATRRTPVSWHERADFDWWSTWLARPFEAELRSLLSNQPPIQDAEPVSDTAFRRMAAVYVTMMACQLGYPPNAIIGGCTVQFYCDVLRLLIARAFQAQAWGDSTALCPEHQLVAAIASELGDDPARVRQALAVFTLDRDNAAYHAAVPGVAAAPLISVDPYHVVLSINGLTTEPLLFLSHELRRRDAEAYHNSAFEREAVFRQELYELFQDKRFVTSPGRIKLRREVGNIRTDIDAAVFDRKTGTLGTFELKSQDPFARSTAALARQRDSFLYANRQISGILDWLKHNGADEILSRMDSRTAKTFRVHKVYPFVLGRYLAHFNDGPEPDRRAAWGTWPQVLRLVEEQPIPATGGNPLASLFALMTKDTPLLRLPSLAQAREITIGPARIIVHSSYAAYQASASGVG